MEPKNLHFGGGVAETVLNPLVLLVVVGVGMVILFRPYKGVIAPYIAASILIPVDQVLVAGGLHFPMLRLLALFGIVRVIRGRIFLRTRVFTGGVNKIDLAVISFTISTAVAGILLFREWAEVIYQLGNVYTAFGVYFLLRFLIRDEEDIICASRTLAYVALFVAVVMTWEIATGHNPYALLGGARSDWYANLMERDDRFRALGCFGHPILAGTFGAIVVPLFVLLWMQGKKHRCLAAVAIASTVVIALTSNSSTPMLAYAAGVLALCLWPLRGWMRAIRWGLVVALVCLHLAWQHPVWYLIAKIDVSGGSSSWHRFNLVDQCIHHFGDWWLVGVKSTDSWGWDMWDTANQYVGICDSSGLLPFALFLAIIVYGFKYLARARRIAGKKKDQLFLWALGAALFANAIAFFGISYWDQTQVAWYALLAMICAVAAGRSKSPQPAVELPLEDNAWAEQFAVPAAAFNKNTDDVIPARGTVGSRLLGLS